ncbi:MAG TPA: hypothetical protein VH912_26820, partial [Streptosporangiaceae bacterium]
MGLSQMHVSRLLSRTLEGLRRRTTGDRTTGDRTTDHRATDHRATDHRATATPISDECFPPRQSRSVERKQLAHTARTGAD